MSVLEDLTEEERCLWAILQDESGIDQAEFLWFDPRSDDGCFRAWPFQWKWWRNKEKMQIDQSARSIGKSKSIQVRMFAFPLLHPGQEAVITAPELVHLEPIVDLVEQVFESCRFGRELRPRGKSAVTHRPFMMHFHNGARIIGRIPQRDGRGIKGCVEQGVIVVTRRGLIPVEEIVVGDEVLTHRNRWRPVIRVDSYLEDDAWRVKGQGAAPIVVSGLHRFWVRHNEAKNPAKQKRQLGKPEWASINQLDNAYWASPSVFPHEHAPPLPLENANERSVHMDEDFWWLVGRYLADGFISSQRRSDKRIRHRVHWCVIPGPDQEDIRLRLKRLGLPSSVRKRSHSSADVVEASNVPWAKWLQGHFGKNADKKTLPVWVLGLPVEHREALLDGYLSGDGTWVENRSRHQASSASRRLTIGMKLLAQSLGRAANVTVMQPKVSQIRGVQLKQKPMLAWRLALPDRSYALHEDGFFWGRVNLVERVSPAMVYNPVVEQDHSYVADGIVCHNTHPLWLELDEASDYPEKGWKEIIETLKMSDEGAVWRAHGVTRGIRDSFWQYTQDTPDNPFKVHRFEAMWRPTWDDQERQDKLTLYGGSRHDPDYRRNVLGEHGDAQNAIFVLTRLMACVNSDESSDYNVDEYYFVDMRAEAVEDRGGDPLMLLDFPPRHAQYQTIWVGMDVGYTQDPSEILVFAEYHPTSSEKGSDRASKRAIPSEGMSRLKLVSRLSLHRIAAPHQRKIIQAVIDFYHPKAFSMDKTGNGLPLYQEILEDMRKDGTVIARKAAELIKGYNFSEKVLVDIDSAKILGDADVETQIKEGGMHRNVLEVSTDYLREYVDHGRLLLPWDLSLIKEFQGQTFTYSRSDVDSYGRRRKIFSQGSFHALDAARMAVMGHAQAAIEEFAKPKPAQPVLDRFVSF